MNVNANKVLLMFRIFSYLLDEGQNLGQKLALS